MPADYSIFDAFCKCPTWDTSHALDEERFFRALSMVVKKKDFSPKQMAEYLSCNHSEPIWPKAPEALESRISNLTMRAEIIQQYFSYIR